MSSVRTHRNRKPSQFTPAIAGPAAPVTAARPGTSAAALAGLSGPPSAHQATVARLAKAALAALAAAFLVLVLTPLAPAPASAATTPKRLVALQWAESQAGKWYCFGGTGPSCFDCSGLVMTAYAQAGITLPRTTYGMLASPKLVQIPAGQRRRGDLAFYGSGHVELVTSSGTFGAAAPGTLIGWHHPSIWWHPTMYFRVK